MSFPNINYKGDFEVTDAANPGFEPSPESYFGWWKMITKTDGAVPLSEAQLFGTQVYDPKTKFLNTFKDRTGSYGCLYLHVQPTKLFGEYDVSFYCGTEDEIFEYSLSRHTFQLMNDGKSIGVKGFINTPAFTLDNYLETVETRVCSPLTIQPDLRRMVAGVGNVDPTNRWYVEEDLNKALYERCGPPIIRPYNINESRKFQELSTDPVALFKYFADIIAEKGMAQVEHPDQYYPGYKKRLEILQSYLDGKTVTYPIHHIQKASAVTSGATNRTTPFFLGKSNLVTVGSTITFSGFENTYAFLNGTHNNDIIRDCRYYADSSQHFDLNASSLTGTFYNTTNFFVAAIDTSACEGVATGPYLGFATNYGSSAKVSVTHHVRKGMSLNNFVGALKAYMYEVYGTQEHASINFPRYSTSHPTKARRVQEDWAEAGQTVAYLYPTFVFFTSVMAANESLYVNPEYSSYAFLFGDAYNTTATVTATYPQAATRGVHVPALNYLESAYNVLYGFTGAFVSGPEGSLEAAVGQQQRDYCSIYKIKNQGDSSVIGGGIMVSTGAPWGTTAGVDWTKWQICGNFSGDPTAYFNKYLYNYMVYGLVKQSLTPGKKVGYVYAYNQAGFYNGWDAELFAPMLFVNPAILSSTSVDSFNKNLAGRVIRFLPIVRFFNEQNVDCVIIDNRNNEGGGQSWQVLFGGDRNAVHTANFYNNGVEGSNSKVDWSQFFGYNNNKASPASNLMLKPSLIASPAIYGPNAVFKGTPSTQKKIVLLQGSGTRSGGNVFFHDMIGDNSDGNIGSNTKVKVVGCSKGYLGGAGQYTVNNLFQVPRSYLPNGLGSAGQSFGVSPEDFYAFEKKDGSGVIKSLSVVDSRSSVGVRSSTTYSWPGAVSNRALPMDLPSTVYPDFGFCENKRPILEGWTGPQQPSPSVRTSWRDGWLETAIQESLSTEW